MEVKTNPYPIKQLKTMYQKDSLNLDYPLQRGDSWDKNRKAELIRSLFINLPILPILAIKKDLEIPRIVNGREVKKNVVIDGKQRLLSVFQYLDDEFPTPDDTIYIDFDNQAIDVSNKRFSELSDDERTTFLNFTLKITQISEYTTNNIENLILAYNSGKPMTTKQKFKIELGLDKTLELQEIMKKDSFFKAVKRRFSKTKNNNNEDLLGLIRAMILLSDVSSNSKSFEFTDMLGFIREYQYNALLGKIKKATKILEEILLQEKSENYVYINNKDWTFYLKHIPYLIYVGHEMPIFLIKKLLLDGSLKLMMPNSLAVNKSEENNEMFIKEVINKIEINNVK